MEYVESRDQYLANIDLELLDPFKKTESERLDKARSNQSKRVHLQVKLVKLERHGSVILFAPI